VWPRPKRTEAGYRLYAIDAVKRVQLVRRALSVGFSLAELMRILRVRDNGRAPATRCARWRLVSCRRSTGNSKPGADTLKRQQLGRLAAKNFAKRTLRTSRYGGRFRFPNGPRWRVGAWAPRRQAQAPFKTSPLPSCQRPGKAVRLMLRAVSKLTSILGSDFNH